MRIPDHISPLVAYRTWQWDALGLKSLNHVQWEPGEAIKAECRHAFPLARKAYISNLLLSKLALPHVPEELPEEHIAPADGCTCGVYAAKNLEHLHKLAYIGHGDIHGEVYLWGKVWDHNLGYRAEIAYPKNLIICARSLPFFLKEALEHLQPLLLYNVDIFLTEKEYEGVPQTHVPLYKKDVGMQQEGMHWLVEYRRKWYNSPRRGAAPLAVGDRVSIRNTGLGVVQRIDSEGDVHVMLWNRFVHQIKGKDIAWSRLNHRWETDSSGYVTHQPVQGL